MSKVFVVLSFFSSLLLAGEYAAAQEQEAETRVETSAKATETSSALSADEAPAPSPGRRRPGAFLGLSLGALSDIGENNQYKVLYGDEKRELGFFAGYYLWSYLVDFGLSFKLGYYNATGHPATGIDRSQLPIRGDLAENTQVDTSQEMQLSLIPVQFLGNVALSPFASRRVVLRAWFGPEWLYVQESVKPDLPSSVSGSAESSFVNKGWNQGTVFGTMLSISITGLEARSDYAMRSIGIDRTYISPFFEIVSTSNDKMGNFDRKNYGIAFNFESLR